MNLTLQVLLIQACQGEGQPRNQDRLSNRFQFQHDGDTRLALIPADERHIIVARENTMVVTASAAYNPALRKYFFKYFAHQLEQSDGITSVSTMVQLSSKAMSLHDDVSVRHQAPAVSSLMRQPLILPRAAAFDKKKVQQRQAG